MHYQTKDWPRRVAVGLVLILATGAASAQTVPWITLVDEPQISDSVCDVVNTTNAELVILGDPLADGTRELVIVTGPDIILSDVVVDVNTGVVFFGDRRFGRILFEDDGDGFRTIWWISDTGRVVALDESAGFAIPVFSDAFPSDFVDVPCDACDFWDDQQVCDALEPDPSDPLDPDDPLAPLIFNLCGSFGGASVAMSVLGIVALRTRRLRPRPLHSDEQRHVMD